MGPATTTYLLVLLGSLILPFCLHILLSRGLRLFSSPEKRQKGALTAILLGYVLLGGGLGIWIMVGVGSPVAAVFLLLVYSCYAYVYFHIFNMSETARRIRILTGENNGRLNPEEIQDEYTGTEMIRVRLRRLVSLGELIQKEDRYYIGKKVLLLPALMISSWQKMLFPDKQPVNVRNRNS